MSTWTKYERMQAILRGEPADRPPVSAWRHFTDQEQNPKDLAKAMIDFQKKYDWDFMKINPRAVYYHEAWGNKYDFSKYKDVVPTLLEHTVDNVNDLEKIDVKSGTEGVFGEQLEAIKLIKQEFKDEVPIFQTIFTPIGILLNLCGERSLGRYREAPREESMLIKLIQEDKEMVHRALKAIATTLAEYAAATIDAGADGVFYAALGMAREGFMTLGEWEEFARKYDLMVLEALDNNPVILHTCGMYGNPQRFVDYPIQILHWAESAPGCPSIAESVDWIGDKAVMGGVDERLFGTGSEEKIIEMATKSINTHKNRPFVLAPECSVSIKTSDSEFKALRGTVE